MAEPRVQGRDGGAAGRWWLGFGGGARVGGGAKAGGARLVVAQGLVVERWWWRM